MTAQERVRILIAEIHAGGTLEQQERTVRDFIDHIIDLTDVRRWRQRAIDAEKQLTDLKNIESWRSNPDQMGR